MNNYSMPIYWDYEDRLPKIRPSQYDLMYPLSRIIDGVRMYPYTRDCNGEKVYLGMAITDED